MHLRNNLVIYVNDRLKVFLAISAENLLFLLNLRCYFKSQ